MSLPARVVVVVPARDEEQLLPRCLASVEVALAGVRPLGVQGSVVVVADSCTDRTAEVAARAGAVVVQAVCGRVGAARAAGVATALALADEDPSRVWLAHTDADSAVPRHWLLEQLRHAATGADAWVGTVRLADESDGEPVPPERRDAVDRWVAAYAALLLPDRTHDHVHGANLGVRADAYLAAGGFDPVGLHEDRVLAARLRAAGRPVVTSTAEPVATSHRWDGRIAEGGVAHDLRTA